MHYHAQLVIPPTDNIEAAVKQVLAPWDVNGDNENPRPFWDWYEIGGRWDNRKKNRLTGEGCNALPLGLCEMHLQMAHVIFARQDLSVLTMYMTRVWNGAAYQQTAWDGILVSALDEYEKHMKMYDPSTTWFEQNKADDDWLTVTVDYHA